MWRAYFLVNLKAINQQFNGRNNMFKKYFLILCAVLSMGSGSVGAAAVGVDHNGEPVRISVRKVNLLEAFGASLDKRRVFMESQDVPDADGIMHKISLTWGRDVGYSPMTLNQILDTLGDVIELVANRVQEYEFKLKQGVDTLQISSNK